MTIEIDEKRIIEKVESKAIHDFEEQLNFECGGALRNAISQLHFERNFKYAWARIDDPDTKDDIAAIILKWVKEELKTIVINDFFNHVDFKNFLEVIRNDEDIMNKVVDRVSCELLKKKNFKSNIEKMVSNKNLESERKNEENGSVKPNTSTCGIER